MSITTETETETPETPVPEPSAPFLAFDLRAPGCLGGSIRLWRVCNAFTGKGDSDDE